ncbi:MAG: hypothetical protein K2Q22_03945 [Cytophagales bacterium]|nr:hypothetical protein [Cytophagales bacterium]
MLAYNKEHLDQAEIRKHVAVWNKNGILSAEQVVRIKSTYAQVLYTPNLFIRIGLFIFTVLCASTANSFLFLITGAFESGSSDSWGIRLVINAFLLIFALEYFIKERKIYKSGIDDALLYMGIGSLISGLCILVFVEDMREMDTLLLFSCVSLPILVAGAIRYSDMIAAFCSFICSYLILFLLVSKVGEFSKYALPFIIMVVSMLGYLRLVNFRKLERVRYWDTSLWVLEIAFLVMFYLSGNYFVVRTLSEELFNLNLSAGEDIPLAFIFYAFTASVPLAYIYWGLRKKNRVLIQTGLILVAISVLTFKYYYGSGHHEITLTIGGIVMVLVAWFAIRYLNEPKLGLTYQEDKEVQDLEKFDTEALVIAQTFSDQSAGQDKTSLGGGSFGGGGASGGF